LDTSSSLALAQSLEKASEAGHEYTSTLLRILARDALIQPHVTRTTSILPVAISLLFGFCARKSRYHPFPSMLVLGM
jgi:hypothetical protein